MSNRPINWEDDGDQIITAYDAESGGEIAVLSTSAIYEITTVEWGTDVTAIKRRDFTCIGKAMNFVRDNASELIDGEEIP